METVKKISFLQKRLRPLIKKGNTIGFVPTMGALHAGHLSLVRKARRDNDFVVVSIFVNPLQFGPREDFCRYPRSLAEDRDLLKKHCDVVFAPSVKEMFPDDFSSRVEVKGFDDVLCARSRPGHFTGVTTVVAKLFGMVRPHTAYFGQKDAQQLIIIKKMARDLNFPVKIISCPIVRETDGLAMSSRNRYLSPQERRDAIVLFEALKFGERMVSAGEKDASNIRRTLVNFIKKSNSTRLDYLEIVDKDTLSPVKQMAKDALLCLAVWIGRTQLIDNMLLRVK